MIDEETQASIIDRLEDESGIQRALLEDAIDAWIATRPQSKGRVAKARAWWKLAEWDLGDAEEALFAMQRPKRPRKRQA